jgi:hypothetical protein
MRDRTRQLAGASLMLVCGVGFVGGAVFEEVVEQFGVPAMARITDCQDVVGRYHAVVCTGTWSAGGRRAGHVVTGTVDGADRSDLGETLTVHLAGGRAYVPSVRIPLILLAFGVAFIAYGIQLLRRLRRAAPS